MSAECSCLFVSLVFIPWFSSRERPFIYFRKRSVPRNGRAAPIDRGGQAHPYAIASSRMAFPSCSIAHLSQMGRRSEAESSVGVGAPQ